MQERMKEHLDRGEQLLWAGGTEDIKALDSVYKKRYIARAVLGMLAALALCWAYAAALDSTQAVFKPWVPLVLIGTGLFVAVRPFADCRSLRKRVCYAVTDKRLMMLNGNDLRTVDLKSIDRIHITTDMAGHCSVVCGDDVKPYKLRIAALCGAQLDDESGLCQRFVFYAVKDLGGLKAALEGLGKSLRPAA